MDQLFTQLFFAFLISTALVLVTYGFAVKKNFYSSIDVAWSYAFGLVALMYLTTSLGWFPRRLAYSALFIGWSFRLGTHLFVRLKKHFPTEDGRYVTLKEKWRDTLKSSFLFFFLSQGISVVLLTVPLALVGMNRSEEFHILELAGILLWGVALVGETISDRQLANFKKNPTNKGKVCNQGLWKYSRHPNYFFEWLVWVSYFVFACGSPLGWLSIICPVIMFVLLFRVTGIPYTEAQSLKSKGDLYREYQRTTSVFLPLPPKKS